MKTRSVKLHRQTTETDIRARLALDGRGRYKISTGIRFLDHMLELFARHGGFDLELTARGDLDVDRFIVATQGVAVRATHESMKAKALAAEIARVLIKGDSTSDPREFDGFQVRCVGDQLIAAGTTDAGDALSLAKLDELIDAVANPTHLIMSKAMRRRLTTASRASAVGGDIVFTVDEFGRTATSYNGLRILVPYSDGGGTEMLAFDEPGDVKDSNTGTTATSIYAVNFADGMVSGIQNAPMDVRDLGELNDTPAFRTRVEWYAGLCVEHGRAVARLGGISNAAVVA